MLGYFLYATHTSTKNSLPDDLTWFNFIMFALLFSLAKAVI